jgi:hypothetical protein
MEQLFVASTNRSAEGPELHIPKEVGGGGGRERKRKLNYEGIEENRRNAKKK